MGELLCLDLACHEGYFALQLALHGCREVLGIDAREENVARATLMRDLYALENLAFKRGNVLELTAAGIGQFDIVLMLGLLYHTPDIVGVLRLARALSKGICLIETQLAPESDAELEWGARSWFGLDLPCAVAPGVDVLLPQLGFAEVEVLKPLADSYEQLARGMRVMIAAIVQTDALGNATT